MEGIKSPFPPANDVPLHRNPPLAPSQEMAYRNKCIQLKRRLQEIETNNDQARRRIGAEKERVQKQRLLRSILLHQLRETMETPGQKFSVEELERLGIASRNAGLSDDLQNEHGERPDGEVLVDDSSENESEEEIPEPSDRPTRNRRPNNNFMSTIPNTNSNSHSTSTPLNPSLYHQPGLATIAPANANSTINSNSYSPAAAREPLLTGAFQTPVAANIASPTQYSASQQSFAADSRFPAAAAAGQSSPIHGSGTVTISGGAIHHPQVSSRPASLSMSQSSQPGPPAPSLSQSTAEPNGVRSSVAASAQPQPVRPNPPYAQFCDHMRPQLEADNYPREHIQSRIDEEWRKLSGENRSLWDERYQEQMRDYEVQMDEYKRATRTHQSIGNATFRR